MQFSKDNRFFTSDGMPLPSDQLMSVARSIAGNKILLAFSGRDSLAMWLYLRDAGFEIIPYFCYTVPGLSYDAEMMAYYETQFNTHIIRLPHPRTYELFHARAYLPAHVCAMIGRCGFGRFTFADIEGYLAGQFGLGDDYLCAVGIKAADNLMRLRMIRQMGPIGLKRRHYYFSIWDWKPADVREAIRSKGLLLSRSYLYFGSTGDGIDYKFLVFLRDNLPEDYRRVLDVFPMADIEIYRHEGVK